MEMLAEPHQILHSQLVALDASWLKRCTFEWWIQTLITRLYERYYSSQSSNLICEQKRRIYVRHSELIILNCWSIKIVLEHNLSIYLRYKNSISQCLMHRPEGVSNWVIFQDFVVVFEIFLFSIELSIRRLCTKISAGSSPLAVVQTSIQHSQCHFDIIDRNNFTNK